MRIIQQSRETITSPHIFMPGEQNYSSDVFNEVPDYWDIKDQSVLIERLAPQLGQIICEYGLHKVFGVSLLHRHFILKKHEKLVRTYTTPTFSVAVGRDVATDYTLPYMWRLQSNGASFQWHPIEFCDATPSAFRRFNAHGVHARRQQAFFLPFVRKVRELGLIDKLALTALYQREEFRLEGGDTLFEETNDRQRLITLRVTKEVVKAGDDDSIKTLWSFSPGVGLLNAASCATHCYGHCHSHAKQ